MTLLKWRYKVLKKKKESKISLLSWAKSIIVRRTQESVYVEDMEKKKVCT